MPASYQPAVIDRDSLCGFFALTMSVLLLLSGRLLKADDPPAQAPKQYANSLSFKDLNGKVLKGQDLRDTEMSMTKFNGADLSGADFTGSEMDRADLTDANLSDAVGLGTVNFGLGITAHRANFQRADFSGARVPGTYFEEADFRGANLKGAILSGRFHDAKFDDADVRETILVGAGGLDALHDDLRRRGAIVTADDFSAVVQAGRDFTDCSLSGFQLTKANLSKGLFREANFNSARLNGANLSQAQLVQTNFSWANLEGANLGQSDLTKAHLIGTKLSQADFTGAKCAGADFSSAELAGAKFIGADLTNADLSGADLTGADFSKAILTGVRWDAAIVKDLKGLPTNQQSELKSQAARWKYDLIQGINTLTREFSMPGWFLTWILGTIVLVWGRRRTARHPSLTILMVLHAVAALPGLSLVFLIVLGVSPVAQMNSGYGGWHLWFQLWTGAAGITLLAIISFIPATIVAWVWCFYVRRPSLVRFLSAATLLTGLSLLASAGCLMLLAPDA